VKLATADFEPAGDPTETRGNREASLLPRWCGILGAMTFASCAVVRRSASSIPAVHLL